MKAATPAVLSIARSNVCPSRRSGLSAKISIRLSLTDSVEKGLVVIGKLKDGTVGKADWIVTNVYEKLDGRWLIVSHHVQPKPQ